jgi:hypothetical protein
MISLQDRQAYKEILLQYKAQIVDYRPTGRIRANRGDEYVQFISQLFRDTPKRQIAWETLK